MAKAKTAAKQGGKVIGYARVSTDKQDADRQKLDIQEYAQAQGLALSGITVETVSSRKQEREVYAVVQALKAGDVLIVTELSRLARSMIELNGIIAAILMQGASLRVVSGQVVDESIGSQSLVFALGIAAQVERDMISERTKSALRARKAAGMKLGRPEGTRKAQEAIKASGVDEAMIRKMLAVGASDAAIARMLNVDARTVRRWKAEAVQA